MRKKLIELLMQKGFGVEGATVAADHLIANGVTIKEENNMPNRKPMTLADTAEMMASADYEERFKAEYHQTRIRYEKLRRMCVRYEAGTLEFEPSCCLNLLTEQKRHMDEYLKCLEIRAEIEGVTL